jgi:hypothetical protein
LGIPPRRVVEGHKGDLVIIELALLRPFQSGELIDLVTYFNALGLLQTPIRLEVIILEDLIVIYIPKYTLKYIAPMGDFTESRTGVPRFRPTPLRIIYTT